MNKLPPKELAPLLPAISEGQLTSEQALLLANLVDEDEECRDYYIDYVTISAMLQFTHGALTDADSEEALLKRTSLVLEVLEEEERAKAIREQQLKIARISDRQNPTKEWSRSVRPAHSLQDVIPTPVIFLATAAALLIVALFFWPQASQITNNDAVASISAQSNAQWQSNSERLSLQNGDSLYAGQRLTLLGGLAEVTTKRGGVLALEGPCSVELIDNDNALRLISGRVVGRVEDDSAKGLLVRTPHMDVTDLGTEFGVEVIGLGSSEVHVFEGSVEVAPIINGKSSNSMTLRSGSALQAKVGASQLVKIELNEAKFVSSLSAEDLPVVASIDGDSGIANMSGNLAWSSIPPKVIQHKQWPSTTIASIHRELSNHRLGDDVDVSYHRPSVYTRFEPQVSATIPKGTVIRSYFIAFRPEGTDLISSNGRITFEGEILGVIAHSNTWGSFVDATHNKPDPVFRLPNRESAGSLDGNGDWNPEKVSNSDMIEIEADGRTISFALQGRIYLDHFRVVIREPDVADTN